MKLQLHQSGEVPAVLSLGVLVLNLLSAATPWKKAAGPIGGGRVIHAPETLLSPVWGAEEGGPQ